MYVMISHFLLKISPSAFLLAFLVCPTNPPESKTLRRGLVSSLDIFCNFCKLYFSATYTVQKSLYISLLQGIFINLYKKSSN